MLYNAIKKTINNFIVNMSIYPKVSTLDCQNMFGETINFLGVDHK